MKNKLLWVFVYSLSFHLQQAYAQSQNGQNDSIEFRKKVVDLEVSADKSDLKLNELPYSVNVLDKEDIALSPGQTIDMVLKNLPGVLINDRPYWAADPTGQSINVRGLGNSRTLVLIDGTPANDPFYGTVEWYKAPISSIESVEFIRGGVSSQWGNYGMGGVINIRTKNPTKSDDEVSFSYGTFNTSNLGIAKNVSVSDDLQLRISGDIFNTDGYSTIANFAPANTAIASGQGWSSDLNSNLRLQGYFKAGEATTGYFALGQSNMHDLSSSYAIATNQLQKYDLSVGTTTKLSANEKIDVNFLYDNGTFYKQNGSAGGAVGYVSQNTYNPSSMLGGSLQYSNSLHSFVDQIVIGVDARNLVAASTVNSISSTGAFQASTYAQGQQNFYGLMGIATSKLSAIPLTVSLSGRLDSWSSSTPSYITTGTTSSSTQNIPDQSVTQFSPTLGLQLQASEALSFRASAYQAFHAPGLNNTLRSYGSAGAASGPYSSSNTGSFSFANPNLTPETMTGFEVGSDLKWKNGYAALTGFSNQITNAVATYTLNPNVSSDIALAQSLCGASSSPTSISGNKAQWGGVCGYSTLTYYTNNQNVQSQGIELQLHQDFNPQWSADLGYTYTNAILTWTKTSDPTGNQLGGVPQNMGFLSIVYRPEPKMSIATNVRWIGSSYLDTGNTLPLPAYALIDLRANYQYSPKIDIYGSIVNLLNNQYITYGTGSSYSSAVAGMPFAMTVGARVKF